MSLLDIIEVRTGEPGSFHAGSSATVLIVEDDDETRVLLCDLVTDFGFRTLAATRGAEALAIIESHASLDLVIADASTQDFDGIALLDAARALRTDMPFLFVTDDGRAALQIRQRGCLVFAKPCAAETVRYAIELTLGDGFDGAPLREAR